MKEYCATCKKKLNPRYSEKPLSKYLKLLATPVRFCSNVCMSTWIVNQERKLNKIDKTVENIHKDIETILMEESN